MPDDDTFDALAAAAELEAELAEGGGLPLDDEIARNEARLQREGGREPEPRTRAVLSDLVGVRDDVERALAAGRREQPGSALLAGVELVERHFLATLGRHGVTRVDALGEPFDPAVHEGVSVLPATEPGQDGRVIAVLR